MPNTQPTQDSKLRICRELARESETFEARRYWSMKALEAWQSENVVQDQYAELNRIVAEDRGNSGAVIVWGGSALFLAGLVVGWITCRNLW